MTPPPSSGFHEAVRHAAVRHARAIERHDDEAAVAVVESLAPFVEPQHIADRTLFNLRCVQADSLFRLGRAADARAKLDWLERTSGRSFATILRKSLLAIYGGCFAEAATLAEQAISLAPDATAADGPMSPAEIKVQALCSLARHSEARRFILSIVGRKRLLSSQDLRLLAATVLTGDDLGFISPYLKPLLALQNRRSLVAMHHYAVMCRNAGRDAEELAALRDRLLLGLQLGRNTDTQPPSPFATSRAPAIALGNIADDIETAGARMFLISGTLLGCIRENALLEHDHDIDVGVMDEVPFATLASQLAQTGRFIVRRMQQDRYLQLCHANGVLIDVFWHRVEDGRIVHEGPQSKWWNSPFGLTERRFLDRRYLIPAEATRYLEENYADWQRPAKEFDTFLDTPNMIVTDEEKMVCQYYRALLNHYQRGSRRLFARTWSALLALHRPDAELRRAVEALL